MDMKWKEFAKTDFSDWILLSEYAVNVGLSYGAILARFKRLSQKRPSEYELVTVEFGRAKISFVKPLTKK